MEYTQDDEVGTWFDAPLCQTTTVCGADKNPRFFACGCGANTLIADIENGKVRTYCGSCNHNSIEKAPIVLNNPDGSASFIGPIPGGMGL